jgi:hypothetical protein
MILDLSKKKIDRDSWQENVPLFSFSFDLLDKYHLSLSTSQHP